MGDSPHDDTPADQPASRPARARPPSSRTRAAAGRPAARGGAPRSATAAGGTRAPRPRPAAGSSSRRPAGRSPRPPAAAPPSDTPSKPRPGRGRERRPASQNTMVVVLSVLSVVVISLVVYAFVLRPSASVTSSSSGPTTTTTVDPSAPGTTLPDTAFATFTSEKMGFSMKYPTSWPTGETDDGEMVVDAGGADAVSARLLERTEVPTTAENLANIKAFTDGVVGSNRSAVVLKVQEITVNGMPGYYYLYTFTDGETGAQGAHAHYFLFRGRNMYTLVFQALPSEGFGRLSRIFDQMAASFQTVPDTGPAPEVTPTTVG